MILLTLLLQTQISRVEISPSNAEIQIGQSVRLTGRALDAQGKEVPGVRLNWYSGGGEGSVDSTGLVTGGYTGYVRVTAVAPVPGGRPIFGQARVRILPLPASRLELSPRPARLAVGTKLTLTGQAYSSQNDVRYDQVAFTSSNANVVRISPDGRLTAVAPGTATITGKAGAATSTVSVDVVGGNVGKVAIEPGTSTVRTGDVVHFTSSAQDASGKSLGQLGTRWSIEGSGGVAQIDDAGAFVAENPGKYTVTGTIGNQTAEAVVNVEARKVGRGLEVVGRVPIKLRGAEVWVHQNGKCAYYSTIADRVYAIDISNPAKPLIVDSMMTDSRLVNDVMTTEDGKYGVFSREGSSNRKDGIVVFDANDPCHPKPIAAYTETVSGGVHSAYVYKGYVYLTYDATGSMRIIDIRDPYKPREAGRWQTSQTEAGRYVHDIAIDDGLAYLSYWNDGLIILDIGNGMKGGTAEKP